MTNELPTLEKFEAYRALDLVQKRKHKELPLVIYTYTLFTQYERLWNNVTKNARGLVFDDKGRVIVRCIPKFFNEEEPHSTCDIEPNVNTEFYDKLDGSLIQVANDAEYGLVITSKGSFHSNQSGWATEYINANYSPDDFKQGLTYVFELIHPDNRIVLDYGGEFNLYLLAVIDIESGKEQSIYAKPFNVFKKVKTIQDIAAHMLRNDIEGIVVKTGTHRYKMKTGEYVRLHRLVTEFTPKRVWEALSTHSSLEFQNMPEEFQRWLDETKENIQSQYDEKYAEILAQYEKTKHLTDKELGLLPDVQYKTYVFSVRNGKKIEPQVWRLIKPKELF